MGESVISRNRTNSTSETGNIKSGIDNSVAASQITPNSMTPSSLNNSLNNSNINPLNLNNRQPLRKDSANLVNYNYQMHPSSFNGYQNNFQAYPTHSSGYGPPQSQLQQPVSAPSTNQQMALNQGQLTNQGSQSIPSQPPSTELRPRGDSIYLPPPGSSQFKLFEDGLPNSRSNSMFMEKKKSNPDNAITIQDFENFINSVSSGNSVSMQGGMNMPSGSGVPPGFVQAGTQGGQVNGTGGSISKESLSNLLAFPFSTSRSNSQDRKNSKSSKNSSIDMSAWESLYFNPAQSQSFQHNSSISNILQGLTNSVEFNNMNTEQRRDSILRFLNDSNFRQSISQAGMNLKEDMFKNNKHDDKSLPGTATSGGDGSGDPMSPNSSLSSKSEVKYELPQSPKTSPDQTTRGNMLPQEAQNHQQNMQPQFNPYYRGNQFNGQYVQPNYNYYTQQQQLGIPPQGTIPPQTIGTPTVNQQPTLQQQQQGGQNRTNHRSNKGNINKGSMPTPSGSGKSPTPKYSSALPKELPSIQKPGKPKLGATKIDQLMLVIQARDKSNKNKDLKIRTNPDGSIEGEIKPQHLIGGVEKNKLKPVRIERNGILEEGEITYEDRRKHNKKLPQCPYCDKYFAQSTQLEVHIRSHIGLKPFECSYCHKRFTQGGNLTTHLRLHTGEKPFSCEICNKSFSRKGNLAAHKLTHDKLKPFDCRLDGCDKSFTQLGNLKSHQNKFHLETLNNLTGKLAELSGAQFDNLPQGEKDLLNYFKNLYKNSNKGIKGRGKRQEDEREDNSRLAGSNGNYRNDNYNLGY